MLRKTCRILAVVGLAGALSLGLAAAPASASEDRGSRMSLTDRRESLQSWLEALLSRLVAVWAADIGTETPGGTPAH